MSRDLIFFAIALMTWGVGESMFFIFQPLYLQQLGATPVQIGGILGGMGIAMAAAHIPAGHLADRIGRRPLIWAAWLCALASAWIMALAPTLPIFIVGMLFYNMTAFVSSPMNSYITTARGKLSTGRALTFISAFFNLGAIIGPWLGGQIAGRYSLNSIYWVSASIFIFSTFFILFIRSQPIDHAEVSIKPTQSGINRHFFVYLGVLFLAMFAMYLPQPLAPNYLQNVQNLDFVQIGQLGSIAGIGTVILNLTLGSLNSRSGFLIGQAAIMVFSLLLWQGRQYGLFCLAYFLLGGFRLARAMAFAHVRTLVHQSRMGLVYGITEAVASSTVILAPPIAGWIYNHNPYDIFLTGIILIIVSLFISARNIPKKPRETSTIPELSD
jgi:MFS family permease